MKNISRRDVLKGISLGLGAGISSRIFMADVQASTPEPHFFLYIHCGSWDGISTGLLQPNSVSTWPRGVFISGQNFVPGTNSTRYSAAGDVLGNRLVAQITESNGHFLSHYANPLRDVSQHLVHVTCAPGSLDHNVARVIQQTGSQSGQPHWISGLAQIFRDPAKSSSFVVNSPFITSSTPDISNIIATDLSRFRGLFQESVRTNDRSVNAARDEFAKVGADVFDTIDGPSILPRNFRTTYEGTMSAIIKGINGVAESDPSVASARDAFSETNISREIERHFGKGDAEGIKVAEGGNSLTNKLILAATLAASGAAYGMVIQMPSEDRHFGGAEINTARIAGSMWTKLAVFWKWLEQEKIQDKVTIIVSHEFTRTPWNQRLIRGSLQIDGREVTIASPGRDHHPINGLYVLNKRIKGGARYGGLRDGFTAAGGRNLGGNPDGAAPTTQQALGTIFLTLFEQFRHPGQPNSGRRVRGIWPTFDDSDIIPPLRGIA